MMKDSSGAQSKKFLYGDKKRAKEDDTEREFHSKGYMPADNKLIDLESVWSVKNITLESNKKPASKAATEPPVIGTVASTSYYSRYGKYGNPSSSSQANKSEQQVDQWDKRKAYDLQSTRSTPGAHYSAVTNPLDF